MTCTRVVIINRGRLAAVDTPVHLAQDVDGGIARVQVTVRGPRDNVQAALPGAARRHRSQHAAHQRLCRCRPSRPAPAGQRRPCVRSVSEPRQDLRARLAAAVVNQNWELFDLRAVSLSLEEVFLRVTATEEETEAQPDDAEYFEPGEEDDLTESEQEAMYEELGDEAEAEDEDDDGGAGRTRSRRARSRADPPPVRAAAAPAARKGGRR